MLVAERQLIDPLLEIGGGVHVLPGVTIGSNVVIGGGSIVVSDIPDNSVAVGNPCKVIRAITDRDREFCWDKRETPNGMR